MKIGVFGNCQAPGFAASIKDLTGWEPHTYRIQEARAASAEELQKESDAMAACDVVFSQPSISATEYGPLSFEALKERCARLIPYPHIAFTGLHPDCHYIRPDGVAMTGPMGPYHSAIVAASFQEGLSPERVSALFNKYAYALLGYLSTNPERQPLVRDAKAYGYDFTSFLQGSRGVFMHTPNHPAINVIFDAARQALCIAGLLSPANDRSVAMPRDILLDSVVWPVYPEIAHAFGIPEREVVFQIRSTKPRMRLEEFIARAYEAYRAFAKPFTTAQIEAARTFIRSEVA
jgi:hypothetical protein